MGGRARDRRPTTRQPDDGSASFDSARAMLRAIMCAGGPERALADAALGGRVRADAGVRGATRRSSLLGEAHLLVGEPEQAELAFRSAPRRRAPGTTPTCSSSASPSSPCSRWTTGAGPMPRSTSQAALAAIDRRRMHDYATAVLAFANAARLAVHRGDVAEAHAQLTRAMRARPTCTYAIPFIAVRVRLQLAKVFWALTDHATARHLLREIDDILLHRPALGAPRRRGRRLPQLGVVQPSSPGPTGGPPLTPAELRLLPYLQTHLSIREIGERLYISRNTVSSEVGSIYRKLGRLGAQRRGRARDGDGPARRLVRSDPGRPVERLLDVVPERHARPWGPRRRRAGAPRPG